MTTSFAESINEVNFVDRLREATSDSHKNLEALPVSTNLMRETLTQKEYTDYLALMLRVVQSVEADVIPMISHLIPNADRRLKQHLIVDDLERFDPISTFPEFRFEATSAAFALGVFYVMEGSTLGGRYILNNVQARLGLSAESGASFFFGYGNATGAMWKEFMNSLKEYAATSGAYEQIIAGALYAFDSIQNYFKTACR